MAVGEQAGHVPGLAAGPGGAGEAGPPGRPLAAADAGLAGEQAGDADGQRQVAEHPPAAGRGCAVTCRLLLQNRREDVADAQHLAELAAS